MIGKLASILKKILPFFLYAWLKDIYKCVFELMLQPIRVLFFRIKLRKIQRNHTKALAIVRNKKKIKVAFFLIHESVWKYEGVYKIMEKDELFEPIVIICPYRTYGEETMLCEINNSYDSFSTKGYNVIKTLKKDGTWLDVKNELKPDIVFFTNPYFLTKLDYYILNYPDTLTFYVPYSFMITDRTKMQYNQELHNLVYKIFHETIIHQKLAKSYSLNKGINSIVTGYPGLDPIFESKNIQFREEMWKTSNDNTKKIIWAPHHTIEEENSLFNYSNFLYYSDFFLELADKYKDFISIAFKPHPILKAKLKKHPEWGESKTNNYYLQWEKQKNCQLHEGEYIDLFISSDAMIHDCGSFLVEYISTNKPSLYMIRDKSILNGFSDLGKEIIDCHYISYTKSDVENFVKEVIIDGNDNLKKERECLIENYLHPPFGKSASQNIFDEIIKILEK
jgi:hypothetical protein